MYVRVCVRVMIESFVATLSQELEKEIIACVFVNTVLA
jgi:hypothetical protein